ncbi:MAG: DUF4255 domain-containing protein [Bacteroidota bacterium]
MLRFTADYLVNAGVGLTVESIGLGNISQMDGDGNFEEITISLVNIEQDAPLRNNPSYTRISDTEIKRHNPYVVLNLYVLFTAYRTGDTAVIEQQLNDITSVIAAFQKKNVFTSAELSLPVEGNLKTEKIIFEQYSMSFEQLNHLWGILGGKYLPSVLYKVRLMCVFVDEGEEASVVESIQRKESVLN